MYSGQFNLNIPGWDTMGDTDWGMGGDTFFATNGSYEGGPDTSGPGWGGGGDMYSGQGWTQQQDWSWLPGMNITTQDIAQTTYDVLDPYYGEGGFLEPVTVIVDPDRNLKDEYGVDLKLIAVAAIAALALLK